MDDHGALARSKPLTNVKLTNPILNLQAFQLTPRTCTILLQDKNNNTDTNRQVSGCQLVHLPRPQPTTGPQTAAVCICKHGQKTSDLHDRQTAPSTPAPRPQPPAAPPAEVFSYPFPSASLIFPASHGGGYGAGGGHPQLSSLIFGGIGGGLCAAVFVEIAPGRKLGQPTGRPLLLSAAGAVRRRYQAP